MTVLNAALQLPYTIKLKTSDPDAQPQGQGAQDSIFARMKRPNTATIDTPRLEGGADGRQPLFTPEDISRDNRKVGKVLKRLANKVSSRSSGHRPWTVVENERVNFGLACALSAAQSSDDPELTWLGTLGMPTDALCDSGYSEDVADCLQKDYACRTVFIRNDEFERYYTKYCKRILWPFLHYQIPDNPKDKTYLNRSWDDYVRINQIFAEQIVKEWKSGDTIWVHDYHLLLVPDMLRQKLPNAPIGLFVHSAFPSSEVFRCIAQRNSLLNGMLGADFIGFQTPEYQNHFLQSCHRLLHAEVFVDQVQLDDRSVDTRSIPIGIHPNAMLTERDKPQIKEWMDLIRDRYEGKHIMVAVDKLDAISGIKEKMLSYEIFLQENPKWRENVILIQISTRVSGQDRHYQEIGQVVDRVNSSFGTLTYQPVVFLRQGMERQQYLALLAMTDVFISTTLREGINLTSHEFTLSQDGILPGSKKHGVLVLSEFSGNEWVFGESSMFINPWNYHACAEAIKAALEMGSEEKEKRWRALYECVLKQDAHTWFNRCNEYLRIASLAEHDHDFGSIPRLSTKRLREKYRASAQRWIVLDYDEALSAPSALADGGVYTGQQRVLKALRRLSEDPKNTMYVMSSRRPEDLDQLRHLAPELGLVAENGCFLKFPNGDEWTMLADQKAVESAKHSLYGTMEYISERIAGSWLEDLHCSIILHYDDGSKGGTAQRQAGEYASQINDASNELAMHATLADNAVTVAPTKWTRHSALLSALEPLSANGGNKNLKSQIDFMAIIGGTKQDEALFRWANKVGKEGEIENVFTVSTCTKRTEAAATSGSGALGVISVLQEL